MLAAGMLNGSVEVVAVDSSRTPPIFSPALTLSGGHSAPVHGLSFTTSTGGESTLLLSAEWSGKSGVTCIWRGSPPPSSSSALLSLAAPPSFALTQKVEVGYAWAYDFAMSPFGSACAFVTHDNDGNGVYFVPITSAGDR
mmetsp:Transcript_23166/g.58735  ORF Transcript_23166/g.58735 Transcript_23166/m.58735 type:complete len:140 (+) Transcript_23166:317-736(+)